MGFESEVFTDFQLDALREIGNVGAGNAATALSQMVGRRVDMSVTKVLVLPTDAIAGFLGGLDQNVAAVHMPIYGEVCGISLVFFPLGRINELCGMLTGKEETDPFHLSEMGQSAIKELGNIDGFLFKRLISVCPYSNDTWSSGFGIGYGAGCVGHCFGRIGTKRRDCNCY